MNVFSKNFINSNIKQGFNKIIKLHFQKKQLVCYIIDDQN